MKALNEQQKNANYLIYLQKLEKYGVKTDKLNELYGDIIKNGSYNMDESDGYAFSGSLVYVTLNILGSMAYKMRENVLSDVQFMQPDINSLMKCVLLSNIGKAVMFVEQTDEWWLKKGKMYRFNENAGVTMKVGARALYMCQECDITLTEDEYEAILAIDSEDGWNRFRTPLCVMLDCVRELAAVCCRKTYLLNVVK